MDLPRSNVLLRGCCEKLKLKKRIHHQSSDPDLEGAVHCQGARKAKAVKALQTATFQLCLDGSSKSQKVVA